MKLKKLFSVLGLGLFAAVSVGAGVALAKPAKAEEVKADENTWMFAVTLKAESLETAYSTSNFRFHLWGLNSLDKTISMHATGQEHIYSVNIALGDSDVVTGGQFIFYQSDGAYPGDKYSNNLTIAAESYSQLSKTENNGISFAWVGKTDWSDGKWTADSRDYDFPKIGYQSNMSAAEVYTTCTIDAANERYIVRNVDITARYEDIITIYFPTESYTTFKSYNMRDAIARANTEEVSGADNWTYLNSAGRYDIIINNSFDGDGIISIVKHEEVDSYIYYATDADALTGDYIYAWGGDKQFGSWPGTPITSVASVKDVTTLGVLHFQGSEAGKRIYKIPVVIGYPGDSTFQFNNGTNSHESASRPLVAGAAYWWTGDANANAGLALDFLDRVETARNAVTATGDHKQYSVCGISKSDAEDFVEAYNALDADIRSTYIDCTTVYTYKQDKSEGNELVSYRNVMLQLSEIAGVGLAGASRNILPGTIFSVEDSTTMIVVVTLVSLAAITATAFVFIKRRKHN